MTRKAIIAAFATIALTATGTSFAQKPLVKTTKPVKSQVRLSTDPLAVDVKSPGTAKVGTKSTTKRITRKK
jgi:hypothetical protein